MFYSGIPFACVDGWERKSLNIRSSVLDLDAVINLEFTLVLGGKNGTVSAISVGNASSKVPVINQRKL